MAQIVFGLKLKAVPQKDSLTFTYEGKQYALPFEVRTVASSDYVFVHVPPACAIMKFSGNKLVAQTSAADAEKANKSFKEARKMVRRKKRREQLPDDVASALKKIPSGFKLGYEEDGSVKLVKVRARKAKKVAKVATATAKKGRAKKAGRKTARR